MKLYLLPVFSILLCATAFSQRSISSSAVLKKAETTKLDSLNSLAVKSLKSGNVVESLAFAKEALGLAEKTGSQKGIANANSNIANAYFFQKNYNDALKHSHLSLSCSQKINDKIAIANAYTNIGNTYNAQKKYSEAVEAFSNALDFFKVTKASKNIADCYTTLGSIYSSQQKSHDALKNLYSGLKIYEQLNDKSAIATCLVKIGWVHQLQENVAIAQDCYLKSLQIREEQGNAIEIGRVNNLVGSTYRMQRKYKEAVFYHSEALKIAERFPETHWLMAMTMARLGGVHEEQGKQAELAGDTITSKVLYGKALDNFSKSLKIREAQGNSSAADDYWHFGSLYLNLKKYDLSRIYLEKALAAYKEMDFKPFIALTYQTLASLDSTEGNFRQANENSKAHTRYYSTYLREETVRKAMQAKLEFDFSKKEDSLKLYQQITGEKLKQQQLLALHQSQKLQLQETSLALSNQQREISTLAFNKAQADLLIEQSDKRNKENQLLLLQKEKALHEAELKLATAALGLKRKEIKSKNLELQITVVSSAALFLVGLLIWQVFRRRQLAMYMLEKQKIRTQIASDLHDDVGPVLTNISFCSQLVKMQLNGKNEPMQKMVDKIGANARAVVNTMSDIVWIVNPDNDIKDDVIKRMRHQMIELCSERKIEHSFCVCEEASGLKLDMLQRKTLYLVFKEALNNAIKYACCSKINTEVSQKNDEILLTVQDNGRGFNPTNISGGNGLLSMQRRANEVNAALFINASPGAGTCVSLKLKIT